MKNNVNILITEAKMKSLKLILAVFALMTLISNSSKAQDEQKIPESMKLFKEKYEIVIEKDFETVWNAANKAIEELGCQTIKKTTKQNDEGLYKGFLHSDFCVFITGDAAYDSLKKYSAEILHKDNPQKIEPIPFIRGGDWVTGRIQYKFTIEEKEQGKVTIKLVAELSGMEQHITGQIHFWTSNGIFEDRILEKIKNYSSL